MRMMLSKFDSNCLSKPTFELFRPISYLYTWYYQVGRPLVVLACSFIMKTTVSICDHH